MLKWVAKWGDKKAIKQQEMQTMMQMHQQMENQKNQELKLGMEMEQFISSADDVARKTIMQQGIREEDRKYIQDLAASERSSIEENIKKHGSMLKYLRAGGYKDLMNYKRSILGSDKMAELESNAAVYSKILQDLIDVYYKKPLLVSPVISSPTKAFIPSDFFNFWNAYLNDPWGLWEIKGNK